MQLGLLSLLRAIPNKVDSKRAPLPKGVPHTLRGVFTGWGVLSVEGVPQLPGGPHLLRGPCLLRGGPSLCREGSPIRFPYEVF